MKKFKPLVRYDMIQGFVANPAPPPKRPKTTTNALTAQIANYVAMRGGYAMRINVGGFYRPDVGYIKSGSTVGVPDLIAVFKGRFVGIEIKTGKDTQSDGQKAVERHINDALGVYIIAHDFEGFKANFDGVIRAMDF